jgi:uncharacterized protein YegJ (DUF2314 family)
MLWAAIAVVVLLVGALIYWYIQRRKRPRMISLVALLREPATLDPAVLARLAGKAWNADLGDGTSEGVDGFVVAADVINTVMFRGRMILINNFPSPYTEDVEKAAESIPDMRLRGLFSEHQAWFSCDSLGVDGRTSEEEVREWYHMLGRLVAELLDENCLLILIPESGLAYPINEDTEDALRSDDPVQALQESLTVPIIQVADDDPLMLAAVEKAHNGWPTFASAYEENAGENFSVKAPITREGNTEFIWISVTSLEGERIYGTLGNDPGNLGSLKFGSKVSVPLEDLNDWCYIDPKGKLQGGFTIEAVQEASRRFRRKKSSEE